MKTDSRQKEVGMSYVASDFLIFCVTRYSLLVFTFLAILCSALRRANLAWKNLRGLNPDT